MHRQPEIAFQAPKQIFPEIDTALPAPGLAMESREHGDLLSPEMQKRFDIVCRGMAKTGANGETQACLGQAVSCLLYTSDAADE